MSIPTALQLCSAVTAWLPDVPARVLNNLVPVFEMRNSGNRRREASYILRSRRFSQCWERSAMGVLRYGVHMLFFHSDTQLYLDAYSNSVCIDEEVVAFPCAQHCHVQMFAPNLIQIGKRMKAC
jgi:hypothetical protein